MKAGVDAVMQLCKTAGIRSPLRPYPATFLGSSEVTLAELALAYTIFPNGGWRPNAPHILERIEEKDGTVVWDRTERDVTKQNVMKPETAYEVHSCLVDALETGTGKAAREQFGLKKFPGGRQDRHRLRFHRRAVRRLRQRDDLRWSGPDSTNRRRFIAARLGARSRCRSGSTS